MSVPRVVATSVDRRAIATLMVTALWRPGIPKMLSQALRLNPCHTKLLLPDGLLKLNRAITMTGSIR